VVEVGFEPTKSLTTDLQTVWLFVV